MRGLRGFTGVYGVCGVDGVDLIQILRFYQTQPLIQIWAQGLDTLFTKKRATGTVPVMTVLSTTVKRMKLWEMCLCLTACGTNSNDRATRAGFASLDRADLVRGFKSRT